MSSINTLAPQTAGGFTHPEVPTLAVPRLERVPAAEDQRAKPLQSLPFLVTHVAAVVGILLVPPTATSLLLCVFMLYARVIGITMGYHRYFAHRSFRTSRVFQLILALWATSSAQKGVLWWAGHHRNHHRYSDRPEDPHSPARRGFLFSHVGWIMAKRNERTPIEVIKDMARYPELRWLDRHYYVPTAVLAVSCFLLGGWTGLVWGYFASTVLLWHATFTINSLCHVFGHRRYPTTDTSRNSLWLTLITAGEGWHNNHHYFSSSARTGFFWWELDPTYYVIWVLDKLGIVWDVKRPPQHILDAGRGAVSSA